MPDLDTSKRKQNSIKNRDGNETNAKYSVTGKMTYMYTWPRMCI